MDKAVGVMDALGRKRAKMNVQKLALPLSLAALLSVAALAAGVGRATPTRFELVMSGFHSPTTERPFSFGFRHEGPFTAAPPFCSSGYALDLEYLLGPPVTGLRRFTCSDGSGTITARKVVLSANAQFTHEEGVWAIVEGTGPYTSLRGKGTFVNDFVSGDPADHITTTFREAWRGFIAFDVTGPDVDIAQASAKRLRRPAGVYLIHVALSTRDANEEDAVSYVIIVRGSGIYVSRSGTTTSATVSTTLRVRPNKRARRLQVIVTASDRVGNETTVARQLKLPNRVVVR
jgi:hypothetical protein